jgi:hypothetical protein
MLTGVQVYDRYALPALALTALLLARRAPNGREPARIAVAGLALALLGLVGLNAAVDSASFDGGRWRLAQRVVEAGGWKPKRVNGGFEWVNFHRGRRNTVAARAVVERTLPDGRVVRVAPFCVNLRVAAGTSVPVQRTISTIDYRALLRPGVRIIAVRSARPCDEPGVLRLERSRSGPGPTP